MSNLVVYTCLFGNTDPLHDAPICYPDTDFICFTDRKDLRSVNNWTFAYVGPVRGPTRAARYYKWNADELFPGRVTLWMDCCFTLLQDPEGIAAKYNEDFYNFRHRDRTRIIDEAAEIARLGKAKPEAVMAQLAHYQAAGFDTGANPMQELSCNGVLLRRPTAANKAINDAMRQELYRHTLRDQMSLDYVAWQLGATLHRWPGTHDKNPLFTYNHYKRPVNDF